MTRWFTTGIVAALAVAALAVAAPAKAAGLTLTVKAVPELQGLDFSFQGHLYTTPKSEVPRLCASRWDLSRPEGPAAPV